jgi:hypothetical protein
MVRGASFHSGLRHETAKQLVENADPFKSAENEEFLLDEGVLSEMRAGEITKRNFQLFYKSEIISECIR